MIIDANNTYPHTARITVDFISANIMRRTLYFPYSPDFTLYNCYLFGYVKESLTGKEFADREELLAVIIQILRRY
jgi:hypothetical protein